MQNKKHKTVLIRNMDPESHALALHIAKVNKMHIHQIYEASLLKFAKTLRVVRKVEEVMIVE